MKRNAIETNNCREVNQHLVDRILQNHDDDVKDDEDYDDDDDDENTDDNHC